MPKIIDRINSPRDLKALNLSMMNQLASEIRELLVNTVSQCGGHLAPNLGVVELTLALHYVFDSPHDKIIWDVGHQSYVHKILTGRKDKMPTLRQYGGLSGFPKYEESEHDVFNTGHSSTSISAALGIALARDLKREKYSVIAVIGDGALTGGMAFEALNHAGHKGTDLIVVLNDNEMSISKNVGALSGYLNRLRSEPSYTRTKEEIEMVLNKIPGIGPNIARAAGRFKDMVKYIMVPGVFFEELGFTYIGPINGHDLNELTLVFSNARKMKGPVLIHAITEKGCGYEPARRNPDVFHGVGPFNIDTGSPLKKKVKTYTEIFGEFITAKAKEDDKIVAITAAMTSGTGLTDFAKKFPDRFFDVGICEQHAVTMAAGMARNGLKPVVAIYSTFLQRAYDQIIHDVALQNLPVIFAIDRAGLVGEDGPTHHGIFDISYLRSIPNLVLMAPSDENEFADMLHTAFAVNGPVAIRYPRGAGEGVPVADKRNLLEIGRGLVIKKGKDLGIIGIGRGMSLARDVAELMKEKGISVYLTDARFIKPLDVELFIDMADSVKRLVTIEDNCLAGGFGSAVVEALADYNKQTDIMRIGIPDEFVEHGKVEVLWEYLNMDPESIAEKIINRWPELLNNNTWELLKFDQNQT
ncbi:1-deoxy-D-xylulose-5-phosphate synthase [Thermosyntropha sp.]|uniref:1-deoxy-D-xylulose-5-phosphate synthase n=1 Tax=Thermosyntropha sp. TaxID=2740820 RepID=UPI0025F85CFF|nr:1-deoxy-D-xylulose-5-phosphate synthase [Thermosyntropha sp.]MBO8159189.1 1-deoxy-D-xylulose-5-phosphate synthase [Thermosyntropha sp.]